MSYIGKFCSQILGKCNELHSVYWCYVDESAGVCRLRPLVHTASVFIRQIFPPLPIRIHISTGILCWNLYSYANRSKQWSAFILALGSFMPFFFDKQSYAYPLPLVTSIQTMYASSTNSDVTAYQLVNYWRHFFHFQCNLQNFGNFL